MSILFSNIRTAPSTDVGTGGMPFEFHAPHIGFALVGLVLRVGRWVDQIAPVFAELRDDGTLGPDVYGPGFGGPGGVAQQLRVPEGHVVTGLQTRSGSFIDGVRLLATRWNGSSLGESRWTHWAVGDSIGGVDRPERLAEPVGGAVVIGIAGRAATYVDNLSFVSAELVRVPTALVSTGVLSGRTGAQASG